MKQRVAIARAFANDPEILLMDEPFSALDAQNKLLLQEELLRIWDEHKKTVVFITHSVDEAVLLGDRIMVMTTQPGRVKYFVPMPLALLIFGLNEGSKIFMVAIGVFFPVAINATTGVLEINKIYLDVGKNYKANRWNTFWTIALPGALPVIMTGFKLGMGIGLVLIAVAEMIGAKSGPGYMIWSAWETFSVEQMYVGLFMIALIGFVLTFALNELERFIIPWKVILTRYFFPLPARGER